jgi:hypothetical protein
MNKFAYLILMFNVDKMLLRWSVEAEILFKVGVSCVIWFYWCNYQHKFTVLKNTNLFIYLFIYSFIHSFIHSFTKMAAMLTETFTHPFGILPSSIKNHKLYLLHHKLLHLKDSLFTCFIHSTSTYLHMEMEMYITVYKLK